MFGHVPRYVAAPIVAASCITCGAPVTLSVASDRSGGGFPASAREPSASREKLAPETATPSLTPRAAQRTDRDLPGGAAR